jgi:UPF0271 protein
LPDRENFGRIVLPLSGDQAYDLVIAQVGSLDTLARGLGGRLHHVKPHGALYWMAETDAAVARAIISAVSAFGPRVTVYGVSGGKLVAAARQSGLPAADEVFADRAYLPDGTLTPRSEPGAVIEEPEECAARMVQLIETGTIIARGGQKIALAAGTVCLHGDHSRSAERAQLLRKALEDAGVTLRAFADDSAP